MRIIDVLNNKSNTLGCTSASTIKVHNLIILDESGSMHIIKRKAVEGVNSTLTTIRNAQITNPGQRHTVSLVTFNSNHHTPVHVKAHIATVPDLNMSNYQPCGNTPLYDAMGLSINRLRQRVDDKDVVLVTIVTDGMENSSRNYDACSIKRLVEEMKAKGWVFTYIGANQDVDSVATELAIENTLLWESDEMGAEIMFQKENNCRRAFFKKLNHCKSVKEIQNDYFKE